MKNIEESIKDIERNYTQLMKQVLAVLELHETLIKEKEEKENIFEEAQSYENIINSFDVILREASIAAIARYQPAARNLRFFTMMIDSSRLLERMGDLLKANLKLIETIQSKTNTMDLCLEKNTLETISILSEIYHKYMEAFFEEDAKKAENLLAFDAIIDQKTKDIFFKIMELLDSEDYDAKSLFLFWNLHKKYERFSDHIMHLTIDLVYILNGENLRKKELESENLLFQEV